MPTFFRQKKEQPFMYSTIVARRSKPNYFVWVIGGVLLTIIFVAAYLIFT